MNWQNNLLKKVVLQSNFCYLVRDPDNLCFEPYIAKYFENTGVELVNETDPVLLRLIYEEWLDVKNKSALIVRLDNDELTIPYDIESQATLLDFHINEVIPQLESTVLRCISPKDYQLIINAVTNYRVGKLNKTDSLDFVLRHVFKIAPEIIQSEVDLVRLLIRKHYLGDEMPEQVEVRLIKLLSFNPLFNDWKFEIVVADRNAFFSFLQRQWELYLESISNDNNVKESIYPNDKLIVPFEDKDIRVFIDNLFADGLLKPVDFNSLETNHWASIGVTSKYENTDLIRITHLLETVNEKLNNNKIDSIDADFWGKVAHEVGVLNALFNQQPNTLTAHLKERLDSLNKQVDSIFEDWLLEKFGSLITIPAMRHPNMLHKVPDFLNRKRESGKKVCLLVMDGMGFQQWTLIQEKLSACSNLNMEERYSFAWVPTITSISRQALFSGKRPNSFADSLLTTSKEESLWRAYWEDKGLSRKQVLYKKKLEDVVDRESFKDLFHSSAILAAGLVVNFIDEQMHGMKAGMKGLNNTVEVWLEDWQFTDKISILLDAGFEIIITSDHGNQEAIGCGWPNEGVKAETKGERVRMYRSGDASASSADISSAEVLEWPAKKFGLPADFYPIVSKGRHAFVKADKKIVGHGGISLHEVVVPFVTITRNEINVKKSKF
jgi:hypothetical protein